MDYLRRVQLRQMTLLGRLLTGEASQEETAEAQAQSNGFAASEMTAEPGQEERSARSGEESAHRPAAGRPVSSHAEQAEKTAQDGMETAAERFYRERQADALWRTPGTAGHRSGILFRQGQGTQAREMEDISRAVQRDARRYDGGFTIY